MRETTQQRNSRIANEDAGAMSAYYHAKDFFNGLATYAIEPSKTGGFLVYQRTPHGQRCGSAKTTEEAQSMIDEWKNSDYCSGYSRKHLMGE